MILEKPEIKLEGNTIFVAKHLIVDETCLYKILEEHGIIMPPELFSNIKWVLKNDFYEGVLIG